MGVSLDAIEGCGGGEAVGERQNRPFRLSFNSSLKVDFQGARVTSDGGLILVRELAWIDNNDGTTVVEVASSVLTAASGITPVPLATTLNASTVGGLLTINEPWGIVFDASGDLWITNEQTSVVPQCKGTVGSGTVVEFPKSQITGFGNLTAVPSVVLTPTPVGTTSSLCDPNGITISKQQNIVVANAGGNSLARYSSSQIGASGSPVPATADLWRCYYAQRSDWSDLRTAFAAVAARLLS
jgi:hypothetical protein